MLLRAASILARVPLHPRAATTPVLAPLLPHLQGASPMQVAKTNTWKMKITTVAAAAVAAVAATHEVSEASVVNVAAVAALDLLAAAHAV